MLVVGAGGIGCELLKILSLTGFNKLSIVYNWIFKWYDIIDRFRYNRY